MNDPDRVRVTGPLAQYVAGFRAGLDAARYTRGSIANQLQLMAQLSRWLGGLGLDAGDLTAVRVDEFLALRRARLTRGWYVSPMGLRMLLDHLEGVGVLPTEEAVPLTATELLLKRYATYLRTERGLVAGSIANRVYVADRFLSGQPSTRGLDLAGLDALVISSFLISECRGKSKGWAQSVTVSMRSLLRYLAVEGIVPFSMTELVPVAAGWRDASLPKSLSRSDLDRLLAGFDRCSGAGRRDYAMVVLAARLGLRAGEIAGLELADVDWQAGELRVRGKGRRVDRLPIPADVGEALADYVTAARPTVGAGVVFRTVNAPFRALHPATVTGVVYRACERVGLAPVGAHRLRHSAATQMLNGGASLPEIAQVLRHRSPNTTAIYAKVDRRSLSALARPWPGSPR